MSNKRRIAIFPVFADTLPVARYFKRYRSDIEIVELLSTPGCCTCGKDAGFLDNREQFGMIIKSPAETNPDSWDELYVLRHDVLGLEETEIQKQLYDPILSIAKSNNKSIRLALNCPEDSETVGMKTQTVKKQGILTPLKQYCVFVGGVIGEANSFEVFLNLYGELSKYHRVAAFSTAENAEICDVTSLHSLLYARSLLESEKVFALNNAVLTKVKETNSEMVLIHVDEAMMSFSNSLTNGFGIVPYMISQIISPDYSICCLPYDCADPAFIAEFAQGLEGRFSFSPDVWHISNALLDHSVATEVQDANAIYAPVESVGPMIFRAQNSGGTVGSLVEKEFFMNCLKAIMEDWKDNQLVEILN